jgi:hypothetical protein
MKILSIYKRNFIVIFVFILWNCVNYSFAARWTLIDFGTGDSDTSTPYSDWNFILRHSANSRYIDPDGNPDHRGITEIDNVPEGETSFFGVKGTLPVNFQPGHIIIATFYNRSSEEEYFYPRISFTDENSPDLLEINKPWYSMFSHEEYGVPAKSLTEEIYYISNDRMINHYNSLPSMGNHFFVNINKKGNNNNLILTKIELSDEGDITPPSAPVNFSVKLINTTQGCGKNLVQLNWSPSIDTGVNSTGIDKYLIYRNNELYDSIQNMMVEYLESSLYYIDLNVAPQKTYHYSVTAIDKAPFGIYPTKHIDILRRHGNESDRATTLSVTTPSWNSTTLVNPWIHAEYIGGIRLPEEADISWEYAHAGLTYYPKGNEGHNPGLELPGSLYAFTILGNSISEITIPNPVISENINDLPRARTIKAPVDLWPEIYSGNKIPDGGGSRASGLGYHPAENGVPEFLYYGVCNSYGSDPAAPSHGVFDMALTQGTGAWHIGDVPPNNVFPGLTAKIIFPVNTTWADANTNGSSLVVGNTYISGSGVPSNGPSLYAIKPWETGSLPDDGESVTAIELLKYGSGNDIEHSNINTVWGEMSEGGAWISAGTKSCVAISYRRSVGDYWYGDDNGNFNCNEDIPEPDFGSRGNGVPQWKTGLMLYNPSDLAAVAGGEKEKWDPKPYVVFDFDRFSMKEKGGDGVAGAVAFDTVNKILFFIEHNGDPGYEFGYSIIHAWKFSAESVPGLCSYVFY